MNKNYTLEGLAQIIDAKVDGDADFVITGLAPLQQAQTGQVSFLDNPKYAKYLSSTQASVIIISPQAWQTFCENGKPACHALLTDQPYLAYAKAAQAFSYLPLAELGVHPSAVIGEDCEIDPSASIGAQCVIERGVKVGKNSIVGAGCVLGEGVSVGDDCHLWANVTLYYAVQIGNRTLIHSGAVLGSDGFGMAKQAGKWLKIPQLGTVRIGNDVEIGANTTIDRGAIGDTVISDGVKLDNQIQVGHNVSIGENTAIAACSGVSGSTQIGKDCMISGMVGFTGHFSVTDNVVITGMTVVSKGIDKPGVYSSGTAMEAHESWKKNAVRFRQLDKMAKQLKTVQQQVNELVDGE